MPKPFINPFSEDLGGQIQQSFSALRPIQEFDEDLRRGLLAGVVDSSPVRLALRATPFYTGQDVDELVDEMDRDLRDTFAGDVGQFVGKWGVELFSGYKAYTTMAGLAAKALQSAVPAAATASASLMMRTPAPLARQAALLAARGADTAVTKAPTAMPIIERLGRAVGGATGAGGYTAGEALGREDLDDASRESGLYGRLGSSFMLGAGITIGADMLLMGAGKALANMATPIRAQEALDWFRKSAAEAVGQREIGGLAGPKKTVEGMADDLVAAKLKLEHNRQVMEQVQAWQEFEAQMPFPLKRPKMATAKQTKDRRFLTAEEAALVGKRDITAKLSTREKAFDTSARQFSKLHQDFSRINANAKILGDYIDVKHISPFSITDGKAWSPEKAALSFEEIAQQIIKTPEDYAGRLGIIGSRIVQNVIKAETEISVAKIGHDTNLTKASQTLARAVGVKKYGDGSWAKPIFDMAEKEGIGKVQAVYGSEAEQTVQQLSDEMFKSYGKLVELGAAPYMEPADYGVKMYFPHVFKRLDDTELREKMLASFRKQIRKKTPDATADSIEVDALNKWARVQEGWAHQKGLNQFGSIDHRRFSKGTLDELIATGAPYEDKPFVAMERYLTAVERRTAYATKFGINGELVRPLGRMVAAERGGGAEALVNNIMDTFYGNDYAKAWHRRWAQNATGLQIMSKLAFAVIPNMSQSANTMAFNGFGHTMKAMRKVMTGAGDARLAQRVGSTESIFQAERRVALGGTDQTNWIDRWVEKFLGGTGFSAVENFNRKVAGQATGDMINYDIGRGISGRLRGVELDQARRRFQQVGLDYTEIVNRVKNGGRLTEREMDLAVHKGAQITQFMPDVARKPFFWTTPVGKVMTQFNSFALGQANFLRNQVLAETAQGNMRPMATIVASYPIAGEFVGGALEGLRDRKRPHGAFARVLDDASLVGGAGLATSAYQALKYDRALGLLAGPTISDIGELGVGFVKFATSGDADRLAHQFSTEPIVQAGKVLYNIGAAGADAFVNFADLMDSQTAAGSAAMSPAQKQFLDLARTKRPIQKK